MCPVWVLWLKILAHFISSPCVIQGDHTCLFCYSIFRLLSVISVLHYQAVILLAYIQNGHKPKRPQSDHKAIPEPHSLSKWSLLVIKFLWLQMKFTFLHTNYYSLLLVFSFDPLIENKQLCFQRVQLFISSPGVLYRFVSSMHGL